LAAATIAAITQLLQVSALTWQLVTALCCFAAALPLEISCFSHYHLIEIERKKSHFIQDVAFIISSIATVAGFGLLFFHLSVKAGIAFCVATAIALVMEWKT